MRLKLGPIDRFIFIGGGRLLASVAGKLAADGVTVDVYTSPRQIEEPLGASGETLRALLDERASLTVCENMDVDTATRIAGDMTESIVISLSAAWIFKEPVISDVFKGRIFNSHGTRLPQDRGQTITGQILAGNRFGHCLLHEVVEAIDQGAIIANREFLYPGSCRIPADFLAVYERENQAFLDELLSAMRIGEVDLEPLAQPEYLATYWPRMHTPTHGWIDWNIDVEMLDRFVCAFDDPYPGAHTTWRGKTVRLKKSQRHTYDGIYHPFQWGIVYRNNGRWLNVAANGGSIILESVVDEDGNDILADIKPGTRFFTPQEKIDQRIRRIAITPTGANA